MAAVHASRWFPMTPLPIAQKTGVWKYMLQNRNLRLLHNK
jgi:hypothetical protein